MIFYTLTKDLGLLLQNYIDEVLKHQILALSLPVRRFLDHSNYPINIAGMSYFLLIMNSIIKAINK